MARRRRLSGEEARERIMDAALEALNEHGPEGLKLTHLARELGVSHQAILHHFGSRDGLLVEVTRRALDGLSAELLSGLAALDDHERGSGVLIRRAFEVMVDQGRGRWLAWLALADPTGDALDDEGRRPLSLLAQMAHSVRERDHGPSDPRDTTFTMILLTYAVLGAAVFERGTFIASGLGDDPDAPAAFREWLRDLIVSHLERG